MILISKSNNDESFGGFVNRCLISTFLYTCYGVIPKLVQVIISTKIISRAGIYSRPAFVLRQGMSCLNKMVYKTPLYEKISQLSPINDIMTQSGRWKSIVIFERPKQMDARFHGHDSLLSFFP